MGAKLTADMKRVVVDRRLAFVATVCPSCSSSKTGTEYSQSFPGRKRRGALRLPAKNNLQER